MRGGGGDHGGGSRGDECRKICEKDEDSIAIMMIMATVTVVMIMVVMIRVVTMVKYLKLVAVLMAVLE